MKSKLRKCVKMLAVCAICLSCCGCIGRQVEGGHSKLNERQMQILEESGLPTDYEELTLGQKSDIEAIEEMLVYLEEKYEIPFAYDGYGTASMFDDERLLAKPLEGEVTDTVEVTRQWNGKKNAYEYEDNYETFLAQPLYQQAMEEYFAQHLEPGTYKVFVRVSRMDKEYDPDNVLSCAVASCSLFIDEAACRDGITLDKLAEDYSQWILQYCDGAPVSIGFFILEEGRLPDINAENSTALGGIDFLLEKRYCSISADGEVNIY